MHGADGSGLPNGLGDLTAAEAVMRTFRVKQGESHATRIPPNPMASLHEYIRPHLFLVEQYFSAKLNEQSTLAAKEEDMIE
jgi:hypothetical protein